MSDDLPVSTETEEVEAESAETVVEYEEDRRPRALLAVILLLLLLLLCGSCYALYSLAPGKGAPSGGGKTLPAGVTWIRSIYAWGPGADEYLMSPTDVAVAKDGTIWVVSAHSVISAYAPDGTPRTVFKPKESISLEGIDVGTGGHLFVTDFGGQVLEYTTSGKLVDRWKVERPQGIDTRSGKIAVSSSNGVAIFTEDDSKIIVKIGGDRGWTKDQFDQPHAILMASSGNFYVADTQNRRVKAFTPSGRIRWITGVAADRSKSGVADTRSEDSVIDDSEFIMPTGLCWDGQGRLAVIDAFKFRIAILDPKTGKVVTYKSLDDGEVRSAYFGERGEGDGYFAYPTGIEYDRRRDRFIVADTYNNRVQIIQLPHTAGKAAIPAIGRGPLWLDSVALSRLQFALTIGIHFLFVPFSIGLGLILVLAERRFYRTRDERDKAASEFWVKIFTATFAVGVATGIVMEFAFGTNWATYSRFVGDVFGSPLAAEGIFAFFLESAFLGVLLFGRERVSRKFYYVSAWLVWIGSLLSALWIIIANSWMQTPAGYKVVETAAGEKAQLTNFFAAALNPSTLPRYTHTIVAVLTVGGFSAMAIAAYYMRRKVNLDFARKTMAVGIAVAGIFTALMLPAGHWQAVNVAENQPSKIAAMEGHWESGPIPLGILGWVDEGSRKTYALEIPGGVNMLTGDLSGTKSYPGLETFDYADRPPVQVTYQSYHFMILLWGLMLLVVLIAWLMNRAEDRSTAKDASSAESASPTERELRADSELPVRRIENHRLLLGVLVFSPVLPMLAIQLGWATAEVGRQPWIVWGELRTIDAISKAVPASEVLLSLLLFIFFYTIVYVAWARVVARIIGGGPALAPDDLTPAETPAFTSAGPGGADASTSSPDEEVV